MVFVLPFEAKTHSIIINEEDILIKNDCGILQWSTSQCGLMQSLLPAAPPGGERVVVVAVAREESAFENGDHRYYGMC